MLISRANNFHKHLFLRHFTICGDWGSTILVWTVTGLLCCTPGRIYWDLKLIGRCRLSSIWWLCGGIRWMSVRIILRTRSRWMSFSSKFLTNGGLQIMKDNIVTIILFILALKSKARLFQQRETVATSADFISVTKI